MGWWITLAILVGLAILPLGVSVKYNADGVWLAVPAAECLSLFLTVFLLKKYQNTYRY